jgi:hypothetical protein
MGLIEYSNIGEMPSLNPSLILFLSLYDEDFSFGDMSFSLHGPDLSLAEFGLPFLDPDCLSVIGDLSPEAPEELSIVEWPNLGELNIDPSLKFWLVRFSSIEEIEEIDFRISV